MGSEKMFTARRMARHPGALETPAGVTALIDEAREQAGDAPLADRLMALLEGMPRDSIEAFQRGLEAMIATIDLPHLHDVAWICDPAPEEQDYAALRANVIALPAEDREAVLDGRTDSLAALDDPLDPGVLYAAVDAYVAKCGEDLFDLLESKDHRFDLVTPDGGNDPDAFLQHAALWQRYGTTPLRIEPFLGIRRERCRCCRNRHSYVEGEVREHGEVVAAYYARYDLYAEHGIHFAISIGTDASNARAFVIWLGRDGDGAFTRLIDAEDSIFGSDLGDYGRVRTEAEAAADPDTPRVHRWVYEISRADERLRAVMDRCMSLVEEAA